MTTLEIVLVLALILPGQAPKVTRTPMDTVESCVVGLLEETLRIVPTLPQDGKYSAACEVTRDPLL